jgi:hypothetical protein
MFNLAICMASVILSGRALHLKQFGLASAFIAIVVASSRVSLSCKIFLLMGLACVGVGAAAYAAFRRQPLGAA